MNNILKIFQEIANILATYPTITKPTSTHANSAVYNLVTAYLHNDHMDMISEAPDDGYLALILLQNHCEKLTHEDKTRYRDAFSAVSQFHDETATAFLKRWHVAKKLATEVGNRYGPGEIIDMLLLSLHPQSKYYPQVLTLQAIRRSEQSSYFVGMSLTLTEVEM